MPERFNPAWEYRVDDPDVAAGVYGRSFNGDAMAAVFDGRAYESSTLGLRFGRGSPDRGFFRLARARPEPTREPAAQTVCRHCGGGFRPNQPRSFCSRDCFDRSRAARPTHPCEGCGRLYARRRWWQRFCSRRCSPAKPRTLAAKPCGRCGREFKPVASRTRFCSRECGAAGNGAAPRLSARPCAKCGAAFLPARSAVRFCSKSCSAAARWAAERQAAATRCVGGTGEDSA